MRTTASVRGDRPALTGPSKTRRRRREWRPVAAAELTTPMIHPNDMPDLNESNGPRRETADRYSSIEYDEQVLVYDPTDGERWVQSDAAVDLTDVA